jgi:RNA polymerase sigma-70 factor (ECF subfamily)
MATLVQQESGFVCEQVRRRLGRLLRREHDTEDIVQGMLLQALRASPRFLVSDRDKLRGLLVRMVENALRVQADRQLAQRRDIRREVQMQSGPDDSVLDLDPSASATDPARAAERSETRDWVRLALELLDHDDRTVVYMRDYEDLTFAEIGQRLGLAEDAVRMRHRRAMPKLADTLVKLKRGDLASLL